MSAEGPRRLLDGGDELNSLVRGALEAERADRIDEARLARIGQGIAFAGASAAPPSPTIASSPPSAAPVAAKSAGSWLAAKGPYVLLAAAIVGGFAAIERTERAPAEVTAAVQPTVVALPQIDEAPAAATPTFAPADLPSAPAVDAPAPPAAAHAKAVKAAATNASPADADEIALLARAHDALHSAPARSLALCKEHETRFAGGHFAQEREAVAIEALLYLGRKDEAARRWSNFQHRYPSSSHRVHLESLFAPSAR